MILNVNNNTNLMRFDIDGDGTRYVYTPELDITTYEVALLLEFFHVTAGTPMNYFDRKSYLKEHNLLRHFSKEY